MHINTITRTIDGVRYEFFNIQDLLTYGFFDIIRSTPQFGSEKVDSLISKKISNWRNIVVEVVRIHLASFGETLQSFTQDTYNRISSFLINTLLDCNYENYYQSIKVLDYASKNDNKSIVFCYNNDKPTILKFKKDW